MPTMQWSRRPVWFSLYRFLSTSLKGLFECAWRAGSFRHQTNFAPVDDLRIHPASISWLAAQWCQSDCWRSSWQHQRPALGQASYQMLEPPGFLSTIKFMGLTWITYELRANQCKSFQIISNHWFWLTDWWRIDSWSSSWIVLNCSLSCSLFKNSLLRPRNHLSPCPCSERCCPWKVRNCPRGFTRLQEFRNHLFKTI